MPIQSDGFGTIVQSLNSGTGGGLAGTSASDGAAGAGAVGKSMRVVQDEILLDDPSCVALDGAGNIWVGNSDNDTTSLVKLDGTTFEATPIQLEPSSPYDIEGDTVEASSMAIDGPLLFVATYQGAIYVIDTTSNAVVGTLVRTGGDANDVFTSVCVDDAGNVYALLATSPSTLCKWTAPYTTSGKLPANEFAMGHNMYGLIHALGSLWAGSGGDLAYLHKINPADGTYVSQDTGMTYAWTPLFVPGLIMIAGPEALHGYDPNTFPSAPTFNASLGTELNGASREVRDVAFAPNQSLFFVFCDSSRESVLAITTGESLYTVLTYQLMDDPMSPVTSGDYIWFCNNDDDASFEGALVRLDASNLKFDVRYQGTTKVAYEDDTGRANWLRAGGGIQIPPQLALNNRVIWQSDDWDGLAITNDGGDRFRLHGAYDAPRHFRLHGSVGASDGTLSYQWYNVTDGDPVGRLASTIPNAVAREALGYLTVPAGQSKVVELRFTYVGTATQIGVEGGPEGNIYPSAFIEVLGTGYITYDD